MDDLGATSSFDFLLEAPLLSQNVTSY